MWEQGGAIERERYTPFGITMDNPASLKDQAGFTGHIKDSATGLNYMQARYYDPAIGRFLSIDPVTFMETGNPGIFNRYSYTMNDPINAVDPFGLQSCGVDEHGGVIVNDCPDSLVKTARGIIVQKAEQAYDDQLPYGVQDSIDDFGVGRNKCNKFVCDIANSAGATVDLSTDENGDSWPPLAGDWGNPNKEIKGWKIVDKPQPGDIIGQRRSYTDASGHVGIVVQIRGFDNEPIIVSARGGGVSRDPNYLVFGFHPENLGKPVIRRYVGRN